MRLSLCLLPALSLFALLRTPLAASDLLTVKAPGTTITAGTDGAIAAIDLRNHFEITDLTSPVVQIRFNVGTVNLQMFPQQTPKTVTNFLAYVNSDRYDNTVLHRSVSNFVVQGGGYTLPELAKVVAYAPVPNEPGLSNLRGTVAMAKLGGDPNSATSEWFFNLGDNSANLDNQNGGFTVFARVAGTGMTLVDGIAALPVYNLGDAFNQFPLQNYAGSGSVQLDNVIALIKAAEVPVFPGAADEDAVVRYDFNSSNPGLITGTLEGSFLKLAVVAGQSGECDVKVTALDSQNNQAAVTFHVVVTAPPVVDPPVVDPPVVFNNPWDAIGLNKSWFGEFNGSRWPVINHPKLLEVTVANRSSAAAGYYFNPKKSKLRSLFTNRQYYPWFYGFSKSKDIPTGWMKVSVRKGKRSFFLYKRNKRVSDL